MSPNETDISEKFRVDMVYILMAPELIYVFSIASIV